MPQRRATRKSAAGPHLKDNKIVVSIVSTVVGGGCEAYVSVCVLRAGTYLFYYCCTYFVVLFGTKSCQLGK